MSNGISVLLPLIYNKQDGPFQLTKTIQDAVKLNFKNLIMTNKGERIMDPAFGVGLSSFLFENYSSSTLQSITFETASQISKYMPFISVIDLSITESKTNDNQFYIYIKYLINSLNVLDELSFVVKK